MVMRIKRYLSVLFVFVSLVAAGQVQKGYVKTKGTSEKPGSGLSGVTVTVRGGNSVVSGNDGVFSFTPPGKTFSFSNVIKKGYMLTDKDFLRQKFSFSSDRKVIVMEKPEQRAQQKKTTEDKLRKKLEADIEKKEAEIAKLEKEGKKSASEIRKLKHQLYKVAEDNEKLIAEMAEHYVSIDYDQMDEVNRQATELIVNGEFDKAKALLDSQGSLEDRINDVNKQKESIEKSQSSLSEWCYNKYGIFRAEHQVDSAAIYIEKRAELDPMNLSWQLDAAAFFHQQGFEAKANEYFDKILYFARWQARDNSPEHLTQLAITLNNLALLNQNRGKNNVESMHKEAITIFKQLLDSNGPAYELYLASAYNNLGIYYSNLEGGQQQSEEYYLQSLDIYKKWCQEDDVILKAKVGNILNNLGDLYNDMGRVEESENMYKDALSMFRHLNESQDYYKRELATSLNGLASLYQRNNINDSEVESLTNEALGVLRDLVKDHKTLSRNLISVLYNKANYYVEKGQNEAADSCFEEAIRLCRPLQKNNAMVYGSLFLKILTEKAMLDYKKMRYDKSEALFKEALWVCKKLYEIDGEKYKTNQAMVLRHLGVLLDKRAQWKESEEMYNEELAINKLLAKNDPAHYTSDVARSYGNMSSHFLLMGDFTKAEYCALAGLEIDPNKLFIYSNLAVAKLLNGNYNEAKEIFEYYKTELKSTFLDDLDMYSSLGIIPQEREKDVEKIRILLNK